MMYACVCIELCDACVCKCMHKLYNIVCMLIYVHHVQLPKKVQYTLINLLPLVS